MPEKIQDILKMVPAINENVGTIFNDDNLITITYPRYTKKWQIKFLLPKGRKNEIKLDFDANGSAVWRLIDGKRSVQDILSDLEEVAQGQDLFDDRVVVFLQSLIQNDFITVE
ncbi:PqqD family protein [Bacteroidales bacterium OttesenSCG-928-M11]|nr:PqqD family protein [Bacteroidales bacterium OttesenSCG-928-M11]